MSETLNNLAAILERRKQADEDNSYVASLYSAGLNRILQKIGEESIETIIAAKEGDLAAIVHETADLWFHTMVLLAHQGLHPSAVLEELDSRFGHSGLEEKAARSDRC